MATQIRIAVLGSGGVGKTFAIKAYTAADWVFDANAYVPTLVEPIPAKETFQDKEYELEIIDTAGQDDMGAVVDMAIQDVDVFIVMYAITSQTSFDELDKHIAKAREACPSAKLILVGCKADLTEDRAIQLDQLMKKAQDLDCPYFECSAKTKQNIKEVFLKAIDVIVNSAANKGKGKGKGKKGNEEGGGGCCQVA